MIFVVEQKSKCMLRVNLPQAKPKTPTRWTTSTVIYILCNPIFAKEFDSFIRTTGLYESHITLSPEMGATHWHNNNNHHNHSSSSWPPTEMAKANGWDTTPIYPRMVFHVFILRVPWGTWFDLPLSCGWCGLDNSSVARFLWVSICYYFGLMRITTLRPLNFGLTVLKCRYSNIIQTENFKNSAIFCLEHFIRTGTVFFLIFCVSHLLYIIPL